MLFRSVFSLIDKKLISPFFSVFQKRVADVNIEPPVAVEVEDVHARRPLAVVFLNARRRRNVFKPEIAAIQIEFIVHLAAREKEVGPPVAVKIAHAHAAAVVNKLGRKNVERVVFLDFVVEINARFRGGELLKKGGRGRRRVFFTKRKKGESRRGRRGFCS